MSATIDHIAIVVDDLDEAAAQEAKKKAEQETEAALQSINAEKEKVVKEIKTAAVDLSIKENNDKMLAEYDAYWNEKEKEQRQKLGDEFHQIYYGMTLEEARLEAIDEGLSLIHI